MRRSWLVYFFILLGLSATAVALWQPSYRTSRVSFPNEITLNNGDTIILGARWLEVREPQQVPLGVNADLVIEAGDSNTEQEDPTGYDLVLVARPDFTESYTSPSGLLSEPFPSGGSVNLQWHIHPYQTGDQQGTLWLYFRVVGQNVDEEQAIFALPIQFHTWGIGGYAVDWAWAVAAVSLLLAGQLSRVPKPKS
jgi:hypothetical protein